jgi:hypothetical protein
MSLENAEVLKEPLIGWFAILPNFLEVSSVLAESFHGFPHLHQRNTSANHPATPSQVLPCTLVLG